MVTEIIVEQHTIPVNPTEKNKNAITELFENINDGEEVTKQEKLEMYEYELQIPIKK